MPTRYRIDEGAGIIYFIAVGVTTEADWNETGLRITQDPRFRPGMSILIDVREHDSILSTDYVTKAAVGLRDRSGGALDLPRWAIVVSRPVSFGLARMFSLHAEGAAVEARVFRDFDGAEKWLKDPDAVPEVPWEPA